MDITTTIQSAWTGITTNVLEAALVVAAIVFLRIARKAVNAGISYFKTVTNLKERSVAINELVEKAKIDDLEASKLEAWAREAVGFAYETQYKSKIEALKGEDVKVIKGNELLSKAVEYVKNQVDANISDPTKQENFTALIEEKVLAALSTARHYMDQNYNHLFAKKEAEAKGIVPMRTLGAKQLYQEGYASGKDTMLTPYLADIKPLDLENK